CARCGIHGDAGRKAQAATGCRFSLGRCGGGGERWWEAERTNNGPSGIIAAFESFRYDLLYKCTVLQLSYMSDHDFLDGLFGAPPIEPYREVAAYESLWLSEGATFKTVAELFERNPGA